MCEVLGRRLVIGCFEIFLAFFGSIGVVGISDEEAAEEIDRRLWVVGEEESIYSDFLSELHSLLIIINEIY